MKSTNGRLIALSLWAAVGVGHGQGLTCGITDVDCFQRDVDQACHTAESTTASALTEQAYDLEAQQEKKWNLAAAAVLRYEDAGQTPRADGMRNRVRQDYGLKSVSAQLAHPELLDADQLATMLTSVCSVPIAFIVGATTCLDSLKASADIVGRTKDNHVAMKLADGASTAISSSGEIAGMLRAADPDWRKRFKEMTRGFITAGAISQQTLSAYGAVVSDPKERVDDMKVAAARFPDNGELAFALGLAHFDYGNRDEAIRSLARARQLLPSDRQQSIDQVLNQATALPH